MKLELLKMDVFFSLNLKYMDTWITFIVDTKILWAMSKIDMACSATHNKMDVDAASVWDFNSPMKKAGMVHSDFSPLLSVSVEIRPVT